MCYFSVALKPKEIKDRAKSAKKILDNNKIFPKYVLGRGISGVLALPIFSEVLKCSIAISRKSNDSSHAGNDKIEAVDTDHFRSSIESVVIVDDFISSGETLMRIKEHMDRISFGVKPLAIVLYCPYDSSSLEGDKLKKSTWNDVPIIGVCEYNNKTIYLKNTVEGVDCLAL